MKLEKLLQYQELDIQLRRQLDIIERSEDAKRIEQAKSEFAVAKKTVEDSERAAVQLLEFFSTCKKYYDDSDKRLSDIESVLVSEESGEGTEIEEGELSGIGDDLEKLRKRLVDIETKLAERKARSESVVKAYSSASERGRKIREFHGKAKERQEMLRSKIEPEIARLREKLAEIEPEIDETIMKQYKSLTAEMKYPAFVEVYADGKTYSCRGCGIALSQTGSSALTDNGYSVCESCRRIIFKR